MSLRLLATTAVAVAALGVAGRCADLDKRVCRDRRPAYRPRRRMEPDDGRCAVGDGTPPQPGTRIGAIVQIAVFDAVNGITRRYSQYRPDAIGTTAPLWRIAHGRRSRCRLHDARCVAPHPEGHVRRTAGRLAPARSGCVDGSWARLGPDGRKRDSRAAKHRRLHGDPESVRRRPASRPGSLRCRTSPVRSSASSPR